MNRKGVTFGAIGAVALIAVISGCSASVENTAEPTPIVSESTLTELATQEGTCAVTSDNGIADVEANDTCVDIGVGNIALLYSLAEDNIADARLDVSSGDPKTIVPLMAPEEDGGFLMGFVGERDGEVTVDVYVTPTDSANEVLVQTVEATVSANAVSGGVSEGGFSFGLPDSAETGAPSWVDPEAG